MSLAKLWQIKHDKLFDVKHWIILRYRTTHTSTDAETEFSVATITTGNPYTDVKGQPACQIIRRYKGSEFSITFDKWLAGKRLTCIECLKLMFYHRGHNAV